MIISRLKSWTKSADMTLFPSFCLNCKKATPEEPASLRWLCVECHKLLIPRWQKTSFKPEINESFYLFDYEKDKIAQRLIRSIKYKYVRDLAESVYVAIEKERANLKKLIFDFIVPVPLHRYRLKDRGFNQSKLIADKIAEITGKEIREDVLKRKTHRRPQAAIKKRNERAKNIENIFKVISTEGFIGQTILLVDDVATTGATLKECARVLRDSGAAKILSFTLAQD